MGFKRNLKTEEIINEIISLSKLKKKPDSIVFMGMGEPLLNYNNLMKSLVFINSMGVSNKRVTVSTCGIVKRIYDLANSFSRPRLAVSLGSAIEEKRRKMIPLSENNNLSHLKKAILFYQKKTRRRVTIEYTIIEGINDTQADVFALLQFAYDTNAHINLIRFNHVENLDFKRPSNSKFNYFKETLKRKNIRVSERYRRGNDISAACGQLVSNHKQVTL